MMLSDSARCEDGPGDGKVVAAKPVAAASATSESKTDDEDDDTEIDFAAMLPDFGTELGIGALAGKSHKCWQRQHWPRRAWSQGSQPGTP
jgi:hypothetical protein